MRKITLLFLSMLLVSCGVKQTQSMLSDGNYDGAINKSVETLKTNKNSKGKQDYVYLLEEAFAKAKQRDLEAINLLLKENNPSNHEKIFNLYTQLNNRQERIKPLLPLKLLKEGRNAVFPIDDYSDNLANSKNNFL